MPAVLQALAVAAMILVPVAVVAWSLDRFVTRRGDVFPPATAPVGCWPGECDCPVDHGEPDEGEFPGSSLEVER